VISQRRAWIVSRRPDATRALAEALAASGLVVAHSSEWPAPEALEAAPPDLFLVDAREGARWAVDERPAGARLVLLVDAAVDVRGAFAQGADDCVVGQPHADEVAARCDAVLRRTDRGPSGTGEAAVYVDGRLWVNLDSRQVWVAGAPVHLTPREFRLLWHLVQHRDLTLSHDQLLQAVWGRLAESDGPTEVLKQYIWRLRQKLEPDPNAPTTIVTDAGEGYRFLAHPT